MAADAARLTDESRSAMKGIRLFVAWYDTACTSTTLLLAVEHEKKAPSRATTFDVKERKQKIFKRAEAVKMTGNGIWVGIDLGTSNCACAVWDSTRGGAKWMRLPRHLLATPSECNGKDGRTVPSAVMLLQKSSGGNDSNGDGDESNVEHGIDSIIDLNQPTNRKDKSKGENLLSAWVGEAAVRRRIDMNEDEAAKKIPASTATIATLVRSVKRILGKRLDELSPELVRSLPLELIQGSDEVNDGFVRVPGEDEETFDTNDDNDLFKFVRVRVTPYNKDISWALSAVNDGDNDMRPSSLSVSPVQILAVILRSIRLAAKHYLMQPKTRRKNMKMPGGKGVYFSTIEVKNVVVGVPAHFSLLQRQLVQRACRMAGFEGHVSTLMESTAAAMAYGLSLTSPTTLDEDETEDGSSSHQTVLVVDMGGGTTDITIATRESADRQTQADPLSSGYTVVVTEGDAQLGGDDLDQAILEFVVGEIERATKKKGGTVLSLRERRALLRSCRTAKEALCDGEANLSEVEVEFQRRKVLVTQGSFRSIISPWIERAQKLVETAVRRFQDTPMSNKNISEVVLVGGTTRLPAVRSMLNGMFPKVELCTSLDPMGSVAQGLAIQAAFLSKDVPKHMLKSALMLDSLPHAIGVQVGSDDGRDGQLKFIPILKRNARLPAFGSATFSLANVRQAGVTIRAVEQIGEGNELVFEPMAKEDFTFMLRRLPEEELSKLSERSIEVGMKVDTDGRFIVSIFDEKDPEQVRKKQRYHQLKEKNGSGNSDDVFGELSYMTDLVLDETEFTMEQWLLLAGTIGMFIFYIAIKIAFAEIPNEEDGARIL